MLLQLPCAFADDLATDVTSPVVSYQYPDDVVGQALNDGGLNSPIVSYQYLDDLLSQSGTADAVISPVVSYLYYEWPGDENLRFQNSPKVSYFYNVGVGGAVTLAGRVVDAQGAPVVGSQVSVTVLNSPIVTVATQPDGSYEFASLAAGIYALNASGTGYASDRRIFSLSTSSSVQNFLLRPLGLFPAMTIADSTTPFIISAFIISAPDDLEGASLRFFDGTSFVTNLSSVDSTKMTIVLTHGFNSSSQDWPTEMAGEMTRRGVPQVANILAWDWENAANKFSDEKALRHGLALGNQLYKRLGSGYDQPLHLIGHSLGTLVQRYTADFLHGDPIGTYPVASPPWDWQRTHLTIFDEAEAIQVLTRFVLMFQGAVPLIDEPDPLKWKDPIPHNALWIDNYISEYGFWHHKAVNVVLQKAKASLLHLIAPHNYPQFWYSNTVAKLVDLNDDTPLGFRRSFTHNLLPGRIPLNFPPPEFTVGDSYHQKPESTDVTDIELLPGRNTFQLNFPILGNSVDWVVDNSVSGGEYVLDQTAKAARATRNATVEASQWTAVRIKNGFNLMVDGAVNSSRSIMDLVNRPALQINLRTGPPQFAPFSQFALAPPSPLEEETNTQSFVWLPVAIPANAAMLAFDFTIGGEGNADTFIFGINDTNLFSIETKFFADGETATSRLIDISAYAATTNELFFGVLGGTSTNCAVTIEGIRFFTLALPALAISPTNGTAALSWPSGANGFVLEASPSLSSPTWTAITNTPMLFDGRFSVANPWPNETRFFRLRHE